MEAGLEHMGRASARGVDAMITVVEPGMRSVQTATRIQTLAHQIGIQRTFVVINKLRQPREEELLGRAMAGQIVLGVLPFCAELASADLEGRPAAPEEPVFVEAVNRIAEALELQLAGQGTRAG
jgi:CO dehydrogenase maturation factor